ncbi:molybdopterin-binding protein [Thalassovita sp.]|uniref:molybdopterin-binding protein n=1 Tax=Thalassovita sp. TaxID=1979401 RepID=UPI0029DE6EB3|nr:molybdopterin-binding protein [Thalassovita sp.]
MKFGPVPLKEAEGAILAHSELADGGRLRKGEILTPQHLQALGRAGVTEVTVARLEPDDLHEDEAAALLAQTLVQGAQGVRLSNAFTGRVNVLAEGPGVAVLDVARLDAANDVHPMITVATVPPYQQLGARGMVATVKIISYGVPKADVVRAADLARGAIGFAAPVLKTASLIVTEIPGGAGEKGVDAIRGRAEALGLTLAEVVTVPHRAPPLAQALTGVTGDLVMILTGSATSDSMDVAPQAVRQAGGTVDRFGMPVDPGNLLFVGGLGGRPVIGLPGCARSPALNGADWVLSRIACGIPVTGSDIARMGVGGLLKEIPTRPMPRRGRKATSADG